MTEVKAKISFVRMSPRKLLIVARALKGLTPQEAIDQLKLFPRRAAGVLLDVFQQAMGNAKNNFKLSPESLRVKSLIIEGGPRLKRGDKAHRGGAVRKKRMAHVIVTLEAKEDRGTKS